MTELTFGVRLARETGITFTGLTEINELLKAGKMRIVEIVPGDTMMNKLGDDGEQVRLTFGGCNFVARLAEA